MSPPEWLSEMAKGIYSEAAEQFPTLEPNDPELLTAFAQTSALVEEMQTLISKDGLIVPNSRGNPSSHPLLNTMRGMLREKTNLAERIRRKHKPSKEDDRFA